MVLLPGQPTALNGGPPILTSVDPDERAILERLAKRRLVLEVGTAYGFSTVAMALAGAKHVLTIDPHAGENPGSLEKVHEHLHAYGMEDHVTVVQDYSQKALAGMLAEKKRPRFGLVFIDGDHSGSVALEDVLNGWRLLAPGGYLAVHDYGNEGCPGVRWAVDAAFPSGPSELVQSLWVKRKGGGRMAEQKTEKAEAKGREVPCPHCNGRGVVAVSVHDVTCGWCHGTRKVRAGGTEEQDS